MDSASAAPSPSRRSRTEIEAAILAVAREGVPRIRILEKTHMHSERLRLYLEELVKRGFIETKDVNGKKVYVTSPRGIEYLEQCSALAELLKQSPAKYRDASMG